MVDTDLLNINDSIDSIGPKRFNNLTFVKNEDIFLLGENVLNKKVTTLEDTLIKNRNMYAKQFDIYENEKSSYEILIEELKKKLSLKENEINETTSLLNKKSEEAISIEKKNIINLINEISSYKSKINDLNNIIEEQKKEINELKSNDSFNQSENNIKYENAIREIEEMKHQNKELMQNNIEFNSLLEKKNQENSYLNNQISALNLKVQENEYLTNQINELKLKVQENEYLTNQINALNLKVQENEHLTNQINELNLKVQENSKNESLMIESQGLKTKIIELEKIIKDKEIEIQTVINEKNQNPNSVKNTEYSRILFSYAQKLLSE